ncbi:MAG: hypothetical protein IIA70_01210 [Proteobacteria bacterium]|nr:hypothetical protein [Pseudomonadota bacterium]
MPDTRISAIGTLSEALSIVWQGRQLVLLLIAFLSVVSLIYMWPMLDWYVPLMTDFSPEAGLDPATTQQIMDDMSYLFVGLIPFLFFLSAPFIIWSRASIGGTGVAMEGGIGALLKRTLWLVWRFICMFGWMILLIFALSIVLMVIEIFTGISATLTAPGDPSQMWDVLLVMIPFYIILMGAFLALSLLYSISMHGEARDFRLPIYKSFRAMKGNLVRATGALMATMMIFYVVNFLVALLFIGTITAASTWLNIIGLFFLFAFSNLYYFIWITYGALYASKLVPELKG